MQIGISWKIAPLVALALGLAVTAWLISAASLSAVLDGFAKVGWGAMALVAVRAATIATNGVAWARLLAHLTKIPIGIFMLLRWMRDAIDALLPVAGIGGGLISARTLTLWRVPGALALASVFADLLLQTIAQVLFALVGAALLAGLVGPNLVLLGAATGLVIAALALAGFYAAQSHGSALLFNRAFAVLSPQLAARAQRAGPHFDAAVAQIWHGRRRYLVDALLVHAFAWALGTLEVWITLYFLGRPPTLEQAVIIESLGTSISIAAMFIPGSWGVQEGGYILIGHFFGVPASDALTLSLVKRIPDLTLGVPGLLIWYALEMRRLLSRRRPSA